MAFQTFIVSLFVWGQCPASCKWRDAQRAMRNRQFIGYTFGPLERNVRERLFDSEGGGAVKFCLDRLFIFGMGSSGKFIFMLHGLGKIYKHGKPQFTEAITKTVMLLKAVV